MNTAYLLKNDIKIVEVTATPDGVGIDVADQWGYIDPQEIKLLKEWKKDPFNWGDNNGFPKI